MHKSQIIRPGKFSVPAPRTIELLSPREWEVACLLGDGMKIDKIAELLTISPATVKVHARSIRRKLGCRNIKQVRRMFSLLNQTPN